ncbi:DUF1707 SHOCT-like domain-containing protein [Nocardioides alcanivorans]|uniref:DUF1707 SHOCT-like domain-containing protein n=1 Tax=Nocardioides alcanivorans TaxID=2897352 RepID=UPI001F324FDD|nr:DUF1707 domain-containing protein [Nocardioides alcanivorans]
MALRARDQDRNQVVETLQQAFVDGQIDADELSRRSSKALAAVHMVELERLIGDLQGATALAPDLQGVGRAGDVLSAPAPKPPIKTLLAVTAVASLLAALVGIPFVLADRDDHDVSAAAPAQELDAEEQREQEGLEHAATMAITWSEVRDEVSGRAYPDGAYWPIKELGPFRVDAATLTTVFEEWEKAFRAPYVHSLRINPGYLRFERPLGRTRPRVEDWEFTKGKEGLRLADEADDAGRDLDLIDLHDFDVEAFVANIERGVEGLNVEDGSLSWADVLVDSSAGVPVVQIWITNSYDETGWMTTTLDGRIVSESPFTPS